MAKHFESVKNKITRTFGDAFDSRRRSDERALSASEMELGEVKGLQKTYNGHDVSVSCVEEVDSDRQGDHDGANTKGECVGFRLNDKEQSKIDKKKRKKDIKEQKDTKDKKDEKDKKGEKEKMDTKQKKNEKAKDDVKEKKDRKEKKVKQKKVRKEKNGEKENEDVKQKKDEKEKEKAKEKKIRKEKKEEKQKEEEKEREEVKEKKRRKEKIDDKQKKDENQIKDEEQKKDDKDKKEEKSSKQNKADSKKTSSVPESAGSEANIVKTTDINVAIKDDEDILKMLSDELTGVTSLNEEKPKRIENLKKRDKHKQKSDERNVHSDNSPELDRKKRKKKRKRKYISSLDGLRSIDDIIPSSNNKHSLLNEKLSLPKENFTSRIFSWLESSKFSDSSDIEVSKKNKELKAQKKREKKLKRQSRVVAEVVPPKIPTLSECTEHYCQKFKTMSDFDIDNPREILVFNFPTDKGITDKANTPATDIPVENHMNDSTGTHANTTNNGTKDDKDTNKELVENNKGKHTGIRKLQTKDQSDNARDSFEVQSSINHRIAAEQDNLKVSDVDMNESHRSSNQVIACEETPNSTELRKQRQAANSLIHRIDLFSGIVLEEALKQQLYQKKGKQEVEAQFDGILATMVARVVDLHRKFQKQLDRAHQANLERLDKEIRICKMVRKGLEPMIHPPQDDNGLFNRELPITAEERDRKCDVYEEILWRSYNSSHRLDYEISLHPGAESLLCKAEVDGIGLLGTVGHRKQEIPRPLSLLDEGHLQTSSILTRNKTVFNVRDKLDENVCNVTCCAFLSDGPYMVADNGNSCVKIMDANNVIITRKLFETKPWAVCVMDSDAMAVSLPEANEVCIMNFTDPELEEVSSFNTGSPCYGLAAINGSILVTCHSPDGTSAVHSYSRQGQCQVTFKNDHTGSPLFTVPESICVNSDQTLVYVSDSGTDVVLGFTLTGCKVFSYNHVDLRNPTAICKWDEDSFVVCGKGSGHVQIVSNAAEHRQTLLKVGSGEGQSLAIDEDNHRFIMAFSNNDEMISVNLAVRQLKNDNSVEAKQTLSSQ